MTKVYGMKDISGMNFTSVNEKALGKKRHHRGVKVYGMKYMTKAKQESINEKAFGKRHHHRKLKRVV